MTLISHRLPARMLAVLLAHLPVAALAAPAAPVQPTIATQVGPMLTVDGLRFRDLDRNGRLDPYEDWRLPVARRVADLVGRMTLEEKAGAMMHGSLTATDSAVGASTRGYDQDAARKAIADQHITSFITRLAVSPERMAEENNAIQRLAAETRLGIPLTISTDPRHHFQVTVGASGATQGYSQWPETLGFAALGDAALMRHFGDVARREYRATGIHMALSPQADLFSEPRWPRGTGTFGANADLARTMVQAYVAGFQGGDRALARDGVATVVKHWVGYGANPQGFDGHNYYGRLAVHDNATLKTHITPFLGAFAAGVAGVMPTYDIISGPTVAGKPLEPVAAGYNAQLLGLLRKDYAYKGLVLSDWGITRDCTLACRAPSQPQTPNEIAMPWGVEDLTPAQRYAKAVHAGIDQFGGVTEPEWIIQDVKAGTISPARVDAAVARILALKFQLGLFENPLVDPAVASTVVPPPRSRKAAAPRPRRKCCCATKVPSCRSPPARGCSSKTSIRRKPAPTGWWWWIAPKMPKWPLCAPPPRSIGCIPTISSARARTRGASISAPAMPITMPLPKPPPKYPWCWRCSSIARRSSPRSCPRPAPCSAISA